MTGLRLTGRGELVIYTLAFLLGIASAKYGWYWT